MSLAGRFAPPVRLALAPRPRPLEDDHVCISVADRLPIGRPVLIPQQTQAAA